MRPHRSPDSWGNVDRGSQHCRFCRFCILSFGAFSSQAANSSRFALRTNLTFRVMDGKSGKIAARNGNEVARSAAKTATFGKDEGMFTSPRPRLPAGEGGKFAHVCGCSRCWRRRWRRGDRTKLPYKWGDVKERTSADTYLPVDRENEAPTNGSRTSSLRFATLLPTLPRGTQCPARRRGRYASNVSNALTMTIRS